MTPITDRLREHADEMAKAADVPNRAVHSVYLRQGADLLREAAALVAALTPTAAQEEASND